MRLNYNPKSAQQLEEERLLMKGEYPFEVVECEKRLGDYGEFILLKFSLTSKFGKTFSWSDIISLSDSYGWKLRHACEEMGLLDLYDKGELELESFLNRRGILVIDHKISKKTGYLEAYVRDYGVKESFGKASIPAAPIADAWPHGAVNAGIAAEMQDDDIPF